MPRVQLNVAQTGLYRSHARFIGIIGGRGSGKTFGGAVKAQDKISKGEPGIVVAPDFPHFTKSTWPAWRDIIPWARVRNRRLNHPYTQDKRLVFMTPHGDVEVHYGGIDDPHSWAGPTVNWFWFDEGARKADREAFDILAGCIRTGENPQGWVTTTPRGINHWVHDVFVKEDFDPAIKKLAQQRGLKLVDYFHATTEDNAANLDEFYYLSLMGTYTGKYREQELLGRFVVFEGAVYEEFLGIVDNKIVPNGNVTEEADYVPGVPVEYGVDDGFTADHPRVFLLCQEIPPYINVFAEYVCTYELPEKSLEHIDELPYPIASVAYIDSSAAELASRLWDKDIDTIRATHPVEEGIKHTRPFIRGADGMRRVRFHPRCQFAISEMMSYSYPSKTTSVRQGSGQAKPAKRLDNAPDALRYLLWHKSIPELDELAPSTVQETDAIQEAEDILRTSPNNVLLRHSNVPMYTWRVKHG